MKLQIDCISCPNLNCPVKHCNPDWLDIISTHKSLLQYPKGQYIIVEDSFVLGAFFIFKGKVKVISSNNLGKEQTVRLATDGHMLGHMGIGQETYPIGAMALEDSKICFVENATLLDAFMSNPKFTLEVMMFYSRELRKSEMRTKCFAQMNNEEKVVYGLIYMIETFGLSEDDHCLPIKLNRQEIADIIGTNPEQVSRALSYLKEKKWISTKDKMIQILNKDALYLMVSQYLKQKKNI